MLCGSAHTGHRKPDINCRAHAAVKKLGLKENLTVGNRYYICRDISRNIARHSLDYGKGGNTAAS